MGFPVSASFGELLRQHRLSAGLSQESLAEKAGISADAVRALERGRRTNPRPDTLALLFAALNLEPVERSELAASIGRSSDSTSVQAHTTAVRRVRPPLPSASLIGRDAHTARIVALIRDTSIRLLTLTGPGGVGKTSLALAVAHEIQDDFPDGVVFVDFATINDARLAVGVMLRALGVGESGDHDAQSVLVGYLEDRRLLLVLDNLEHLLSVAPLVADLVQSCSRLVFLATSRTPLRLRAEQRFSVPPLAVPSRSERYEEIANAPAVQLFLARARAAQVDFELTEENAADVAEICARLDGLPLAIELAAARVTILSPASLLDRLSRSLDILKNGPRDLPDRHQTLRATVDWSHQLLTSSDQALFRRLAVFVGGFDAKSAEAVCSITEPGEEDVLIGLSSLLENSLLRTVHDPTDAEIRLGMLETVRQYAVERLEQSGERDTIRRSHASYYQRLAEEAGPHLVGPRQREWLARLDREHDNLRATLDWAGEQQDVEAGLRISAALWRFWWTRGHLSEGRGWFDTFLRHADGVAPELLASALSGAGILAWAQGDCDVSVTLHQRALSTWQEQGNKFGVAKALNNLGLVALDQNRLSDAIGFYEQSLTLHREAGTRRSVAGALLNFGSVLLLERRWDRAGTVLEETLALYQELDDIWGMADTLRYLGALALALGDCDRATLSIREALSKFNSIGDQPGIAVCLEYLAFIAATEGHGHLAARYHGAATEIRLQRGIPLQASMRATVERMCETAIALLGRDQFVARADESRQLPLHDVILAAIHDQSQICS